MAKIRFNRDNMERLIKDHRKSGKAQSTHTDDMVPGFLAVAGNTRTSFYIRLGTKRLLLGHWPAMGADQARHKAMNAKAAHRDGVDVFTPEPEERAPVTLQAALDAYISHGTRKDRTNELYRYEIEKYLSDWTAKPLEAIDRKMVDVRLKVITKAHGWSVANRVMSLLRSIFKGPRVDNPDLRNPVEDWLAAGGKFHPKKRRGIDTAGGPIKNLAKLHEAIGGIENIAIRDAFMLMLYTGLRRNEALMLRWSDIDFDKGTLTVADTKNGKPLTIPLTVQVRALLERRFKKGKLPWVFHSPTSASGHVEDPHHLYKRLSGEVGEKVYAHAFRNTFIHVGVKKLGLSLHLVKRLVNHAAGNDVTLGYTDDWDMDVMRDAAQRINDTIIDANGLSTGEPLAGGK